MIPHEITLIIPLILSLLLRASSSPSLCPLDLDYVEKIEWDTSSCRSSSGGAEEPSSNCCQTLTSLYGVAFAHRLKITSLFRVGDLETSTSCLSDFQSKLSRLGLRRDLASACFSPHRFVNTTDVCAGVQTTRDWAALLGESTSLHADCSGDLSNLAACDACVIAGFQAQSQLLALDGDISHSTGCFHYTILYAAGIVNELGPHSAGALSCIFGLPLVVPGGGGGERSIILASAGAGFAAVVITCVIGLLLRRERQVAASESSSEAESESSEEDRPLLNWRPKADTRWFTAAEIERATDRFSSRNLIGRGQFGVVYKGKLRDDSLVAVKKVVEVEFDEFVSEVEIISTLRHRNLVPLRGCCVDDQGRKYLVYDYMPNGNLGQHLYPKGKGKKGKRKAMSWPERKSVILDVANALLYLHRGVSPPVYHRDIKPTNILLDRQMRARVADFGLARRGAGEEGDSHLTTRIAGTHGYLAPEYALYGQLTEKSDVYSFGIVVLEMMCGRKVLDFSSATPLITDWAWPLVKAGRMEEVVDPWLLSGGYPQMIMERFVIVGILCAHLMVAFRPTMLEALRMLEGDIELPTIPDRPSFAPFPNRIIDL